MILLRLLLRFLLVPLGGAFAMLAAVIVVSLAHWSEFVRIVASDPEAPDNLWFAVLYVGPRAAMALSFGVVGMLLPGAFGALIAEAFALRSWVFHSVNGALAGFIGWLTLQDTFRPHLVPVEPTVVVGAGIVAGFAYWLIAGWSAGFFRPVFSAPQPSPPPATAA
ncbi:MAG TPA: hypothetical protein VNL39_03200 [Xanthobacteraceae bacterium]|nr:hypothetical protein [Xanthobacteraceae bacterium]